MQVDKRLGAKKDRRDWRDYRLGGIQFAEDDLPDSFRLNDPFPLKNQNGFGSCTAQATSYHKQIQEGKELSARYIYARTKQIEGNTSWGAHTRNAFKVLTDYGAVDEIDYPERHDVTEREYLDWNNIPNYLDATQHKSESYWRVGVSFNEIASALYKNRSIVVISVPWYNSYNTPDKESGNLEWKKEDGWKYGHAVAVCGWKANGWLLVKNSWGEKWGLNGYCYFHKSYPIWDAWVSRDIPKELPVDMRYNKKRNYFLEKKTAFNPWLLKKIVRLPTNREIKGLVYGSWDYEAIFEGRVEDQWLYKTKY